MDLGAKPTIGHPGRPIMRRIQASRLLKGFFQHAAKTVQIAQESTHGFFCLTAL